MNEALDRRVDALYAAARKPRPHRRADACPRPLSHDLPARGARLGAATRRHGSPPSSSASRASARSSRRTFWRTKNPIAWCSTGRPISRGLPPFLREAAARAAEDAGMKGKHVITLSRSSIEPFLQFSEQPRPARAGLPGLDGAGRHGRRHRQQGDHRRDHGAARRAGEAARLRDLRGFQARRHHGEDAERRAGSSQRRLGAGPRPRHDRAGRSPGVSRKPKATISPSSRGTGATTPRRSRLARHDLDEAVIKPYFQLDRIIAAAFETAHRLFGLELRGAEGLSALPSRCPRLAGARRRRRGVGTFLGDYFARHSKRSGAWMSAFRSQENLDRRHPADHRQRDEFRQGRRGRAVAPELRRRPHALPRIRPCPARAVLRRHLSAARRHQRLDGFRRAARRSSTSIGCRSPRSCAATPPITGPASRSRRRCSSA